MLLFPETLYAHPYLKYRCKLTDLGIPELQRHQRLVEMGGSTLRYLAPEALLRHKATEKVDVWALGCVLVRAARSRRPLAPPARLREARRSTGTAPFW